MIYYLGLGSNCGNRERMLRDACSSLRHYGNIQTMSSLYYSEPYGPQEQPCFLNIVCRYNTVLRPQRLLRTLKKIEMELGRVRTYPWGPRYIDIDIIDWNGEIHLTEILKIPHSDLENRNFVLIPLQEIEPAYISRSGEPIAKILLKRTFDHPVKRLHAFHEV